ncbi:uncharacterized protein UV8b_06872 [Ustilaginoidea virens]|uniref:Uncharacterized protein n=1 Tax=Ustilaginoidea virens TaxID=1159556 RepID=A0A8E5HW32_USTVR|nr:uncharacterized protein UV8b_06872 [Ustilaginoidea virens]QUC22631.1 hypothetical protein UV8b_06872 [Ustilaginoidea virens]
MCLRKVCMWPCTPGSVPRLTRHAAEFSQTLSIVPKGNPRQVSRQKPTPASAAAYVCDPTTPAFVLHAPATASLGAMGNSSSPPTPTIPIKRNPDSWALSC